MIVIDGVEMDDGVEDLDDDEVEYEPCLVCGGTDYDYDGFCPQCEIALEIKQKKGSAK